MAKGPGDCGWTFGHTWSLAFEEQYYLIVPLLLASRVRWLVLPFVFPIHFIGRIGAIQIYMLLGLGALVAANERRVLAALAMVPPLVAIGLLCLSGLWMILPPGWPQVLSGLPVPFEIVAGMFGLPEASPRARDLLASWPLRTIGLYSYSLYLWHQLALTHQPLVPPVLGLVLALAFSVVTYHSLERAAREMAKRATTALLARQATP